MAYFRFEDEVAAALDSRRFLDAHSPQFARLVRGRLPTATEEGNLKHDRRRSVTAYQPRSACFMVIFGPTTESRIPITTNRSGNRPTYHGTGARNSAREIRPPSPANRNPTRAILLAAFCRDLQRRPRGPVQHLARDSRLPPAS